jgi:hypothetical protein
LRRGILPRLAIAEGLTARTCCHCCMRRSFQQRFCCRLLRCRLPQHSPRCWAAASAAPVHDVPFNACPKDVVHMVMTEQSTTSLSQAARLSCTDKRLAPASASARSSSTMAAWQAALHTCAARTARFSATALMLAAARSRSPRMSSRSPGSAVHRPKYQQEKERHGPGLGSTTTVADRGRE